MLTNVSPNPWSTDYWRKRSSPFNCRKRGVAVKTPRAGQSRMRTPYLSVYLVIFLPNAPYIHRILTVLANPGVFKPGIMAILDVWPVAWLCCCVVCWLAVLLCGLLVGRAVVWLVVWLCCCVACWLAVLLCGLLPGCAVVWFIARLCCCVACCLAVLLCGLLVGRAVVWLVGWPCCCVACCLAVLLCGLLVGRAVVWLVAWLCCCVACCLAVLLCSSLVVVVLSSCSPCWLADTGIDFVMSSVRNTPFQPLCFSHRERLCHVKC